MNNSEVGFSSVKRGPLEKLKNTQWSLCCSRIGIFLLLFGLCFFFESMGSMYIATAVQSLERQFQISSKTSGLLVSAHEIGYIPAVVILSYLGSKGNRARWIGAGCLLIAVGNMLASLPGFAFNDKEITQNDTEIHEMFVLPQYLSRPNVSGEELLDYDPVKYFMPTKVRQFLLSKIRNQNASFEFSKADLQPRKIPQYMKFDPKIDYIVMEVIRGKSHVNKFLDALQQKLIEGPPEKVKDIIIKRANLRVGYCDAPVNRLKERLKKEKCKVTSSNDFAFGMVLFALLLVGIGHSVPWSLGVPLIDDNVKRTSMPFFFALLFLIKVLGPISGLFIGGAVNTIYTTLKQPIGMTPEHPRWIGAWWLGYLFVAVFLTLPALGLFCFPNDPAEDLEKANDEVEKPQMKRQKSQIKLIDKHIKEEQQDFVTVVKKFFLSLLEILKSKVYVGAVIGKVSDAFAMKGFMVFLPKYLSNHYGISQRMSSNVMGLSAFGFIFGIMAGSLAMQKFKLEGRKAATWVGVCSLISAITSFGSIALGCHSVVNNIGQLGLKNDFNFTQTCNTDCMCGPVQILPVCSQSGQAFFSPCHAGCRNLTISPGSLDTSYSDCSCVANGKVSSDWCTDDCYTMMILNFILFGLGGFVGATSIIPGMLIVLRAVPAEHRSISMGFSAFVVSLGGLAAPVLYGAIIDSACLRWEATCEGTGSCSIYEPTDLRIRLYSIFGILKLFGLIFDIWVWYFAKDLEIMKESETPEDENQKNDLDMKQI